MPRKQGQRTGGAVMRTWTSAAPPTSRSIVTSCSWVVPRTMVSSSSTRRLPATTSGSGLYFMRAPSLRSRCVGSMKVRPM